MENIENSPTDRRPLGFWLRTVDGLLTREFATALAAEGVDRRDWMLLNAVSGEVDAPWLTAKLARGGRRIRALVDRGWIAEADGRWTLTETGREARDRLGGIVDGVRSRVAGAASPEDYATTLRTLEAIAAELGWDGQSMPERGRGFGHRRGFRHGFGHGHGFGPGHGVDQAFGHGHSFDHGFGPGQRFGHERGHGFGPGQRFGHGFGPGHHFGHHRGHGYEHGAPESGCHHRSHGHGGPGERLDAYERGFTAGFEKGRASASAPAA